MIIPRHNNIMSTTSETIEVGGQQSKHDTLIAATSDRRRSWLMSMGLNSKVDNFYTTGLSGRSITMGAGDSTRSMLSIDLALQPEDFDGGLSELIMESADCGDANEIELLPSLPEYELQQQYSTRDLCVTNMMADEYKERWASGLPEGEVVCGEQPCPVVKLTAKLKRVSTAERKCDDMDVLNEDFTVTSRDWGISSSSSSIKNASVNRASNLERVCMAEQRPFDDDILNEDFTVASRDWGMHQSSTLDAQNKNEFLAVVGLSSLFMNNNNDNNNKSLLKRASSLSLEEEGKPTLSNENVANSSSYGTRSTVRVSNSSSKASKSKPPRRVIDVSRSVKYTDDDVLLGRGGFTNTHPGNIRFREKALELRQLYESSDKEQKFALSKLLLGSVTDKGNHFLERGDDGLWHEVVGGGARKKASQALRERIKGSRR